MREIYPEAVREDVLAGLEPTFLQGEQVGKWCNGAAEDKALIPNGYVGDPKGSQYIETNLKEADRRIARDIVNSFGKQVNGNYEQRNKPDAKDAELFFV